MSTCMEVKVWKLFIRSVLVGDEKKEQPFSQTEEILSFLPPLVSFPGIYSVSRWNEISSAKMNVILVLISSSCWRKLLLKDSISSAWIGFSQTQAGPRLKLRRLGILFRSMIFFIIFYFNVFPKAIFLGPQKI